ncbi:MAG: hypothetical protein U0231_00560 [Nitrospiraceae bacterium]
MSRVFVLFIAAVLLTTVACASKPKKPFQRLAGEFVPPVNITKPVDQQSAAVGITIKTDKWLPGSEDRVYLVRVDREQDLFQGAKLIPTSIVKPASGAGGGTAYVQNLPPGRYAAVAFTVGEKRYGKTREITQYLLPKELVKQSETLVTASASAFMGEYELGASTMVLNDKAADDVQSHYFEAFWGRPLESVIADLRMVGTPAYFSVHSITLTKGSRDSAAEQRFMETARRDMEPSWGPVIDRGRAGGK